MRQLLIFLSILCRKLSYEVDQLLKDMEPEICPILNDEGEDKSILNLIKEEEKVLQAQLQDGGQQKSKLSSDLDAFLNQVQSMHSGFTALKQGSTTITNGRHTKISLPHHQLHVESHHERSSSLDTTLNPTNSYLPNHRISMYSMVN